MTERESTVELKKSTWWWRGVVRHQSGWSGRGGLPGLLAPPYELADPSAGMFLSGLPELRRQAAV